jgi:hypothetical protein
MKFGANTCLVGPGWDFFARVLKTCGIVTSMPMVVVAAVVGVRRSTDMSRVKGPQTGVVGKALQGLTLDVVFGADQVS